MYSPEEIRERNREQVSAIFSKFEPLEEVKQPDHLQKSVSIPEDKGYWLQADLDMFREDLFKGIDEETISKENLEKAQDDLLNLKVEMRDINGVETRVFVQDNLEKGKYTRRTGSPGSYKYEYGESVKGDRRSGEQDPRAVGFNNLTVAGSKIASMKSEIKSLEQSLEKYMESDLSDSKVRSEMRRVLNEISSKEDKLSKYTESIGR